MKRFLSSLVLIPLVLAMSLVPVVLSMALVSVEKARAEAGINGGSNDRVQTTKVEGLPSFAGLVQKLKPSVVNISTTSVLRTKGFDFPSPFGEKDPFEEFFKGFFGEMPQQEFRQQGLGSGFVVSEDGYVVTNTHVIDKAKDIQVTLADGEKYEAKVIGRDSKTDIALLKIDPRGRLQAIKFGDSDKLSIGDWVIAIGNPFGLGHTVTAGIVSATGRALGMGNYDDFIQTDAPINPGNSGGPLFDLNGDVIGVNSAIVAGGQGIGFSIPSNMVKNVVEQLETKGKVVRGWLGVLVQPVTPEIAESMNLNEVGGALVADVTPDSPAQKAGIKRGDVVIGLDGQRVGSVSDLTSKIAMTSPGTNEKLDMIREGKEKEVTVKIGELPEKIAGQVMREENYEQESEERLGLSVEEITPEIANQFNLAVEKGVVVTDVAPGSVADEVGFRQGDVILEINRRPIKSIKDYRNEVNKLEKGKSTLFLVKRGENTIYAALKIQSENESS
jgi:serine protease Do